MTAGGGLDVEVIYPAGFAGTQPASPAGTGGHRGAGLPGEEVRRLCALALASAGIENGHLAVEFVDSERITALNRDFRGKEGPTDVLSFPVDAGGAAVGEREIGDVVICPEHTEDLAEAVVHGALHLGGMDHETDEGEMLAVQAEILSWVRP